MTTTAVSPQKLAPFPIHVPDSSHTDEAFVRELQWSTGAGKPLRQAARKGDVERVSKILREALAGRAWRPKRSHATVAEQLLFALTEPAGSQPGSPPSDASSSTHDDPLAEWLTKMSRAERKGKSPERLTKLVARLPELVGASHGSVERPSPRQSLVLAGCLAGYGSRLTEGDFFSMWRHVLSNVADTWAGIPASESFWRTSYWLPGELAWLSAALFGELRGAKKLEKAGRIELSEALDAPTDTDGTPHATTMDSLPIWLASLTRVGSMSQSFGASPWKKSDVTRITGLVTRALAASAQEGLPVEPPADSARLLLTAAKVAAVPKTHPARTRAHWLGTKRRRAGRPGQQDRRMNRWREQMAPSFQSDWAELSCLRTSWGIGSSACVVRHTGTAPAISLVVKDELFASGIWNVEVEREGELLDVPPEWSCVCWFSDETSDYVELQVELAADLKLTRYVLLPRNGDFLYLAETLKGPDGTPLGLRSALPMAPDVSEQKEFAARDVTLRWHGGSLRAFPLSLRQDRLEGEESTLQLRDGQLESDVRGVGGLCNAVVLHWGRMIDRMPADWRSLTVASEGRRVTPSEAVGYRLRIGGEQYVFYHSLTGPKTPRTVLGHHTFHESVLGQFDPHGQWQPLVQVE